VIGTRNRVRIRRPRLVNVKALRSKVSMTQEQFAARSGFSTATLRHRVRGDRAPQGSGWSCQMSWRAHRAVIGATAA